MLKNTQPSQPASKLSHSATGLLSPGHIEGLLSRFGGRIGVPGYANFG